MFRRAWPQMRQSAGNSVAKRLSARWLAREAIEERLATEAARVARVRSPVLLKTSSSRPESTLGSSPNESSSV
jgi:hypothetical protein